VLGRQTQLKSPPSAVIASGGHVVVGYGDGQLAVIDPATGAAVRTGSVLRTPFGRDLTDLVLDELVGTPRGMLVAGRFAERGKPGYRGFVQEMVVPTLAPDGTSVFDKGVPLGLRADAAGRWLCLLSDGSVVDSFGVRANRRERPRYFLPVGEKGFVTATRGASPTAFLPDGQKVPLGAGSGPLGLVDLGAAGYAVLLGDAGAVVRIDRSGQVERAEVADLPYAGVLHAGRLLVGQANGDQLVVIDPASFEVERRITVDQGIDMVVSLG
jgi:hypothetical protein